MFKFNEILFFRGINHEEIFDKLKNGYYSNIDIGNFLDLSQSTYGEDEGKIINIQNDILVYDKTKNKFSIKINGSVYTMLTTNDGIYTDKDNLFLEDKCCDWCGKPMKNFYIGIPIDIEDTKYGYEIKMDGCFHSFRCCYASLIREKNYSFSYRNSVYTNSEMILLFLYREITGKDDLKPEIDFKLLKNKEIDTNSYNYVQLPGFEFIPTRQIYQQIKK
jgi:hypothetical protein